MKTVNRIVYARSDSTIMDPLGVPYRLVQGEPWAADDPLVLSKPECFSSSPPVRTSDRGWVDLDD